MCGWPRNAFRATSSSNATQVRRILRDDWLTVAAVLDPLIQSVLAQPTPDLVYLCLDESHHTDRVRMLQIVIATDAMALPIRFVVYDPHAAWADAARRCLEAVAPLIASTRPVIVYCRACSNHDTLSLRDQWNEDAF